MWLAFRCPAPILNRMVRYEKPSMDEAILSENASRERGGHAMRGRNQVGQVVIRVILPLLFSTTPVLAQGVIQAHGAVEADLVMVYGALDGPNALTTVNDLVVSETGRVFVAQASECVIKVFNPDGSLRETIGGRGRGPGEFQDIGNITLVGGELHVFDPVLSRRTVFSQDGTRVRDERVRVQGVYPQWLRELHANGDVDLARVEEFPSRPQDRSPQRSFWLLVDSGTVLDTLGFSRRPEQSIVLRLDRGWSYQGQPFDTFSVLVPDEGRAWLVQRTNGDIVELTLSGDTAHAYQVGLPQSPVDRQAINRAVDPILRRVEGRIRNARGAIEDALLVPDSLPALRSAIVGRDGTVWLRSRDLGTWWVVSTRTGRLYEVQIPDDVGVTWSDKGSVWGVRFGEFNEPYVVQYALHGGEWGESRN